jgi:hypothetical protein
VGLQDRRDGRLDEGVQLNNNVVLHVDCRLGALVVLDVDRLGALIVPEVVDLEEERLVGRCRSRGARSQVRLANHGGDEVGRVQCCDKVLDEGLEPAGVGVMVGQWLVLDLVRQPTESPDVGREMRNQLPSKPVSRARRMATQAAGAGERALDVRALSEDGGVLDDRLGRPKPSSGFALKA